MFLPGLLYCGDNLEKPLNFTIMENIDWSALGFDYHKTDVNVRYYFTDGKWSDMEVTSDEYIKMHMLSLIHI